MNLNQKSISLSIYYENAQSPFSFTKIVTISPLYLLVNKTNFSLHFEEYGFSNLISILPENSESFSFYKRDNFCVRLSIDKNNWSHNFSFHLSEVCVLKLRKSGSIYIFYFVFKSRYTFPNS